MAATSIPRRSFIGSVFALPCGQAVQSQRTSPSRAVAKVAAGAVRFNEVLKLPAGDLLFIKLATDDTGGALFITEQPIERRRSTITKTRTSGYRSRVLHCRAMAMGWTWATCS